MLVLLATGGGCHLRAKQADFCLKVPWKEGEQIGGEGKRVVVPSCASRSAGVSPAWGCEREN